MTMELTMDHGVRLLQLARETIGRRLGVAGVNEAGLGDEALRQSVGTFVTLKSEGQLRGCIGNLEAVETLVESVARNALSAAFHDHRFPPLTAEEWPHIHIDISVLTPAGKLEYRDADELVERLRPGIDGVILQVGAARATFLPQVWEQLPDPALFLDHLCLKAGLPKEAWRADRPAIFLYQVRSFSEYTR